MDLDGAGIMLEADSAVVRGHNHEGTCVEAGVGGDEVDSALDTVARVARRNGMEFSGGLWGSQMRGILMRRASVPEPGSGVMLALGALALSFLQRRRVLG